MKKRRGRPGLLIGIAAMGLARGAGAQPFLPSPSTPASPASPAPAPVAGSLEALQKERDDLMRAAYEGKATLQDMEAKALPWARRALAIAQGAPGGPASMRALDMAIGTAPRDAEGDAVVAEAMELVLAHHPGDTALCGISQYLGSRDESHAGPLLDTVIAKAEKPIVQVLARIERERQLFAAADRADAATRAAMYMRCRALLAEAGRLIAAGGIPDPSLPDQLKVETYALENLAIGQVAPALDRPDVDGKPLKLESFRGKVVVLSFWADWCVPCRALLPVERAMVEKYASRPFQLLGINLDPPDRFAEVRAREKIGWPNWRDSGPDGELVRQWNVRSFPTIFVLDAEGRIRQRHVTGVTLESSVEALLAEIEGK